MLLSEEHVFFIFIVLWVLGILIFPFRKEKKNERREEKSQRKKNHLG